MSAPNAPPDPRPDSPVGDRLDSWKEIAAYLKRSVRSVQRWEAEEGMPIHRHLHEKRGTVYAFRPELDAWWRERGVLLVDRNGEEEATTPSIEPEVLDRVPVVDEPPGIEEDRPPRSRRAALIGAGFALAALSVAMVAWLSSRNGNSTGSLRPLPFKARDWVLVAAFENRTGERLFDGTLDYALGRELSNSSHVNVVSRERVSDALRLMRKPLDTLLDVSLAREVSLRDGGIRALLTGRIEKLGSKYVFSVELIEPKEGVSIAGFSEESAGTDGSLAAMGRISDRVRAALGETLVPDTSETSKLAKVTTSSLRALQLYSQADALMGREEDSQSGAEELLRQAVTEDPSFASAYIHLAHAIHNQGRPLDHYRRYLETAFRLAETTTERERYFIRGSYYQLLGEREKAIAAYDALLSLFPDHPWATGNLVHLYDESNPGDIERIVRLEQREADARPADFNLNWNTGHNLVVYNRDFARAEPYLQRARRLLSPVDLEESPWAVSWLELLPFTRCWVDGDVQTAAVELDRIAAKVDSLTGGAKKVFAVKTALGYLTLGRFAAAEQISERILEPLTRNDTLAQVSHVKGDRSTLVRHLQLPGSRKLSYLSPGWWQTIAILQARTGLISQADQFLDAQERAEKKSGRRLGSLETVRGEVALARRDLATAIRELEQGTTLPPEWWRWPGFYLGSESLAAALAKKGKHERAIQVLERASEARFQAIINNSAGGAYWLRNRLALARLYRDVGRTGDAVAIETELLKLLALADESHPIVAELRRSKA